MLTTILFVLVVVQFVVLVGVLIVTSRRKYDGSMVVTDTASKKVFTLEIDTDPDKLDEKKSIVLKVEHYSEAGART